MNLYLVSGAAIRDFQYSNGVQRAQPTSWACLFVSELTREAAYDSCVEKALELFPPKDGWYSHTISIDREDGRLVTMPSGDTYRICLIKE